MIWIIGCILLWGVIGSTGFYFWWTRDYPLDSEAIWLLCVAALFGPISWILGYHIHGKRKF